MEVSFPHPTRFRSSIPELEGLRHNPFVNVDGEPYGRPKLNGRWRVDMQLMAHGMHAELALDSFITAISHGGVTCVIPICVRYRPNNEYGRMLASNCVVQEWTDNHTGFIGEPFKGFTLINPVSERDSYIDVNTPELSALYPGHYISLGNDRLYKVQATNSINESPTQYRIHVAPLIRGNHAAGDVVYVDQLRLRCQAETITPIGLGLNPFQTSSIEFVESF